MRPEELRSHLEKQVEKFFSNYQESIQEIGTVISVSDGIVQAYGLDNAQSGEVVKFNDDISGIILNLEHESVCIVILSNDTRNIRQGDKVYRTHKMLQVPRGKGMLGRVVNAIGDPIDGKGPLLDIEYATVEAPAPGIVDRKSVSEPLQTGIKVIDSLVPIGRGQRELLIGDRQTGKSAIAIAAIMNQKIENDKSISANDKVYCVYVAIGQKMSTIAKLVKMLDEHGAMEYSTIVVASASDSAAMQFIAPYTGCSIGEYYRDNSMHSLVVYDDLSKNATAYRQISLLLRRAPGREAYPPDIFYLHSRLLERAAKLSDEKGGGSLTALPIVETQAGDVSAYIPTNIISITDGQIFLEAELFRKGIRPAMNIGLSVSRVGSAAQTKAMKQVAAKMKLELAQYREIESFAQFGSDLDQLTQKLLNRGEKLTTILCQKQTKTYPMEEMVISLFLASRGYLDDIKISQVAEYEEAVLKRIFNSYSDILIKIRAMKAIDDEIEARLRQIAQEVLEQD